MKHARTLMLAILLTAMAASCTIKEERVECPCWLSVSLEKARQMHPEISQDRISIAMWDEDLICREKVDMAAYPEYPYYQRRVPRGQIMLSAYSGQEKMTARDRFLHIEKGRQCDSIFAYSRSVDCTEEHAMDEPVLHKQFATIYIRMACNEGELFSFGVRFRSNTSGFNTIDMSPLEGDFEFRAFGEGEQGNLFSVRVPRQLDDSLKMEILSGDGIDDTIEIGSIISGSGYSWSKPDLDDIRLDVEHAMIVGNIEILPWQEDFRDVQLPADIGGSEIVMALLEQQSITTKTMSCDQQEDGGFNVEYIPYGNNVRTKAGLEDISSLYWSGTAGPWKMESLRWNSSSGNISGTALHTGKYQSNPCRPYNYYVSNVPIDFSPGGSTIDADCTKDVVAGCTDGATDSTNPFISLEHILARTGSVSIEPPEGCTINPAAYVLFSQGSGGTKGRYNIATREWSDLSDQMVAYTLKSDSDMYLIPGEYLLRVGIYLRNGNWTKGYVKEGRITLKAGCINNITVNAKAEYHTDMPRREFYLENNYQRGNATSFDHFGSDQIQVTCNGTDVTSDCTFHDYDTRWFDISSEGRITCPVSGSMIPDGIPGTDSSEVHESKAVVRYTDPSGHIWEWFADLKVLLTNEDVTS